MADDIDEPPFKFIELREKIELKAVSYNPHKKSRLKDDLDDSKGSSFEVKGGIYRATGSVEGVRTDHWNEIVSIQVEESPHFLTLHALKERLENPSVRQQDFDDVKRDPEARPFELWSPTGLEAALIPSTLILRGGRRSKKYDDELDARQLEAWKKVVTKLGGQPPLNSNPMVARFLLKPTDDLKKKDDLLYCSPADTPAFGVTKDKLTAVIAAHTGHFLGWPDPVVLGFEEAKRKGLRLVGRHFLQLYFVWMKPSYYEELWKQYGVTKLLHAIPAEDKEKDYQDVDEKMLIAKTKRTGPQVDGTSTTFSSRKPSKETDTKVIMGKSATEVAEKLWKTTYITSGMGKKSNGEVSTVEWLHRVARALNGLDAFKNLIFGTWECNTDMVRAENFVRKLTEQVGNNKYEGKLTTLTKPPGLFSRPNTLEGTNTDATIPSWADKYPWLCFSLNYQYQMNADKCPLDGPVMHSVDFDPWSLYTPLSMEPQLDMYILQDLKSRGSRVGMVSYASHIVNLMVISQPLENIPVPEYPTLAWNAAINELPSVDLPDIIVKNPTVASPPVVDEALANELIIHHPSRSRCSIPVDTPIPEGGFVLQGEVDLFGTTMVSKLEKWIGPPPGDVVVGIDPPCIERVVIPGDFNMSMLIPLLARTPFDKIIFRNVAISYQNYAFNKTMSVGWHFNADWIIDSSCGLLYDILRTVLQIERPSLSIHAAFGKSLQWFAPLNLQGFILEGLFSNLTLSPVSGLTLTTIGVRLLGIRGFAFTPKPHSTLSFGFGIFGTMKLNVPESVVPLNLDYEMRLIGKTVNLRAEISGSIWEDALGVEGLLLEDVVFGTSFSASSPLKTFSFDVSARFSYLSSVAYLHGSYAAGGHFSFMAELDNFGINELNDLFYTLFGNFLKLPDFDVRIGSAIVSIISGQGLSVSLLDVEIAGHTAVSVKVTLSSSGASFCGELSSSAITFGEVELREALIKLAFWTTDKKKKVDLMLCGKVKVDFLDLQVGAAVHLYPGKGGVEWAVVAELSAPSQPFAISDVVPVVKDTGVDFSLSKACIIAASQDDPLISESFPSYRVRKGVWVFGVIDSIEVLDKLLPTKVNGLVFNAGWSKISGFNLMVSLPVECPICLGNGIKTRPITLGIRTSPPGLAIMAGVTVPVEKSTPLDFSFTLAANITRASGTAQMKGWWDKPFGVDNLKIGPEVTLSIEITYATFVTTGLPSGFAISGGLMIGTMKASMAMSLSGDPTRQMLCGKLEKLAISDVVEFASILVQQDIPKVPDNLLKFEALEVYVSPFGVTLGETEYPPGFRFKADLVLFDKRANIECAIDKVKKSVDIVGGVDNFELGPLTVRGSKGPRATLECHVGIYKQQLLVDGLVRIFDGDAETYINIQFLPDPKFKFYLLLKWADIFMFKLDAELLGSIHSRLSDADFSLDAELQNDILEYIARQVIEQFEAAKVAATQGIQVAQKKVDDAKKDWENGIANAQTKYDYALEAWKSYERSVRSSSQPIIDYYLSELSQLQGEVDKAAKVFNDAMDDARRQVNQANQARPLVMAVAQCKLNDVNRDMNMAINVAQGAVDVAEAELSRLSGKAQRDLSAAQQEVNRIRNQLDAANRIVDENRNASGFWDKLVFSVGAKTLETSMDIASATLGTAQGVLQGSEIIAKMAGAATARKTLDDTRSFWEDRLSEANVGIAVANETTKAAFDTAETLLENVKKGAKFIAFETAKEALEGFKQAHEAAYELAMAAIKGLMNSAEYIACTAANAGLEVARASTKLFDAAKGALVVAETASQATLSILQEVVNFAATVVNIKTIILSGTLRGVLGIGGASARPLTAVVKGYVLGQWFDIKAEFDPRKPMEFITAIFNQLWDLVCSTFKPGLSMMAASAKQGHVVKEEAMGVMMQRIQPRPFLASSRFLQQRPDVLKMLTGECESISTDIPCGPFSGTPIVSSAVVASKALTLMEEERGISVLEDIYGVHG